MLNEPAICFPLTSHRFSPLPSLFPSPRPIVSKPNRSIFFSSPSLFELKLRFNQGRRVKWLARTQSTRDSLKRLSSFLVHLIRAGGHQRLFDISPAAIAFLEDSFLEVSARIRTNDPRFTAVYSRKGVALKDCRRKNLANDSLLRSKRPSSFNRQRGELDK